MSSNPSSDPAAGDSPADHPSSRDPGSGNPGSGAYRALVEGLPDPVGRARPDGVLTYANPACRRRLGDGPGPVGRAFREFLDPEDGDRLDERLAGLRPERPSTAGEWRVKLPDGTQRWHHWTHQAVFGPEGEVVELQFVGRDVTDERAVRERVQRDQRLASIGTLAAGIAHEINNPIGAILLAAQTALRYLVRGDGETITREALELVEGEALRCGRIVKSLLSYASSESAEPQPADVEETLQNARQLTRKYAQELGAEVAVEVADDARRAVMNPTEIEQVLVNLIRNAAEAGGGVRHVRVAAERAGDRVRLAVHDDGPGMPPEVRERSFDPFYSTRDQGVGLGLSVAHGIVGRHGSEVHVDSEPGRGTSVWFDLPAE